MLCIYDTAPGDAVGIYCAKHREVALGAMAQGHDYPMFQAWAAASESNRYQPHVDACSPYFRTAAAAALSALRV